LLNSVRSQTFDEKIKRVGMQGQSATVRFASLARLKHQDLLELRKMAGPVSQYPAGSILQTADTTAVTPVLLLSGWASGSIALQRGGRQIVKIHMPGDLLGLTSLPYDRCVDTITALTEVMVCVVPPAAIGGLFEHNARLAALLFLISLEERVMLVDRLVMVGRAETSQRIAALILQLRERLMRSDPATGLSFTVPLTQVHIADMVGATTVHVSRTIQDLAAEGLMKWERGRITILNLPALEAFAGLPSRDLVKDPDWLPAG
jgi:CRP-like cAMP-binding protein